jgi:uncharacterized protein (TIGR02246 family)
MAEPSTETIAMQFRQALPGLQQRYTEAYNHGDLVAICSFYTDAAYIVPPTKTIVQGHPAIRAYHEDRIRSRQRVVGFTTVAVVAQDAAVIEIADATVEQQTGEQVTRRVIAIWKQQRDGTWKLDADIFP